MRQNANLDILRSIAVSTVLLNHLVLSFDRHGFLSHPWLVDFTAELGHAGVMLFFVHTSLVLMYSLARMYQGPSLVPLRFYIRRIFRIYPLAIFVILLAVALHIPRDPFGTYPPVTKAVVLSNLFLVQNLVVGRQVQGPLWSLPYEVQMYAVLPLLYWMTRKRQALTYTVGLLLAFWTIGLILFRTTGHLNVAAYIPCFLAGILCFVLRHKLRPVLPAMLWAPYLVGLVALYCLVNWKLGVSFWSGWVLSLIAGLSIPLFHESESRVLNFTCARIALYSYGIYLLNISVLYFVFEKLQLTSAFLSAVLYVGLTLVASVITFHLIESPCIELGRRLSSPGRVGPMPEPSSAAPAP